MIIFMIAKQANLSQPSMRGHDAREAAHRATFNAGPRGDPASREALNRTTRQILAGLPAQGESCKSCAQNICIGPNSTNSAKIAIAHGPKHVGMFARLRAWQVMGAKKQLAW